MHLSDSGGLAEGDFDYEPDYSFLLTVEKDCKTLSNIDFTKYFDKKQVFIDGQLREIAWIEQIQGTALLLSSFGNGECSVSCSQGIQEFLAQKQNDYCQKSLTSATRATTLQLVQHREREREVAAAEMPESFMEESGESQVSL